MPTRRTCLTASTSCNRPTCNIKLLERLSILKYQVSKHNKTKHNVQSTGAVRESSANFKGMDQYVLYYVILFIWLLPFSFGSEKVHYDILDTCLDGKFHKEKPSAESELFSQCSPWKNRSCCSDITAKSLHKPMHYNFNFDHCSSIKPISEECRMHFIQDLCFYECSPNVGPWLVKVNMKIRKERFFEVPLCESDCNSWYEACKNDFTCNGNWIRGWKWNKTGNHCPENATCQTFKDIFHNSKNFCEKVWDHSWKVIPDSDPCMKIWFDEGKGNPNDAVAKYYVEKKSLQSSSPSSFYKFYQISWIFIFSFIFFPL